MTKVTGINLLVARIPLKVAYPLSFKTVKEVESLVVHIGLENGKEGLGEAVPLPGYSSETLASVVRDLRRVSSSCLGMDVTEIPSYLNSILSNSPFAVSAILSALEMATGLFSFLECIDLPIVAPIASSEDAEISVENMKAWYKRGYRTIKLKVGRNINADCRCLRKLLVAIPDSVRIRVDANQAYSPTQARMLLSVLEEDYKGSVEIIEQPFGIDEWNLFEELVREFPKAPLMLDESIINDYDVERAADVGASFIKLKLFKHHGPNHVIALIRQAADLGLGVVFGNGVCTDLGNLIEASIFQSSNLCFGAFEGNGFEKLTISSVNQAPTVRKGNMYWNIDDGVEPSKLLNRTIYTLIEKKGWASNYECM